MVIVPDHGRGAGAGQQALRPRGDQARRARPGARRSRTRNRLGAVVLVSRVDDGLDRAMRYVDHLDADRVRAVHVGAEDRSLGAAFWARYGCKLEFVDVARRAGEDGARAACRANGPSTPDHLCAVVVPETDRGAAAAPRAAAQRRAAAQGRAAVREGASWSSTSPRIDADDTLLDPAAASARGPGPRGRPSTRARAKRCGSPSCCGPDRVRAVHIAELPEDAETIEEQWAEQQLPVPLDIVAAPVPRAGRAAAARGRGAQGRGRRPRHRRDRRVRARSGGSTACTTTGRCR